MVISAEFRPGQMELQDLCESFQSPLRNWRFLAELLISHEMRKSKLASLGRFSDSSSSESEKEMKIFQIFANNLNQ